VERARPSRRARFDDRWRRLTGSNWMAGVDEVGRGCLAGPVVVAAVVLPPGAALPGVRDSKQLSAAARERAFLLIHAEATAISALAVHSDEVDRLNVLGASLAGMERVVQRLERRHRVCVDHILVDGHQLPAGLADRSTALVKGDDRSQSIAAASIVAKVLRDRVMRAWARRYPVYGFERHVGYPTPEHRRALEEFGPCELHRESFAPVARARKEIELRLRAAADPTP
jgi:ribonuclease HII